MKKQNKISFGIIIFILTFLCSGLNLQANCDKSFFEIEQSENSNEIGNHPIDNIHSNDDDQINQTFKFTPNANTFFKISTPKKGFLMPKFPASIWQPPQ